MYPPDRAQGQLSHELLRQEVDIALVGLKRKTKRGGRADTVQRKTHSELFLPARKIEFESCKYI